MHDKKQLPKTLLKNIYDNLYIKGLVNSQSDFGKKIGNYNRGYISSLLKSNDKIPPKIQEGLNNEFKISLQYMASNGKEGQMFDSTYKNDSMATPVANEPNPGNTYSSVKSTPLKEVNELLSSSANQNTEVMMNRILDVMNKREEAAIIEARAKEKDAEARIIGAEASRSMALTLEKLLSLKEDGTMGKQYVG